MHYSTRAPSASISYPNHPGYRTGSPETSEDAANAIGGSAEPTATKSYGTAGIQPVARSSEQIAEAVGMSHWAVRPRVSELIVADKIERTSDRATNDNGRSVVLWRAVGNR